jgi:anti-sigma B factor antagonist
MLINRPVIVMQLPEQLVAEGAGKFLQELGPLLEVNRPRIVLDCSQVRNIDSNGVEMLLHCVEESMKRDGDLKLACVSPESRVILELMRVDRVFEMFESSEEAVRSFNVLPLESVAQDAPWYQAVFGDLGPLKQAS